MVLIEYIVKVEYGLVEFCDKKEVRFIVNFGCYVIVILLGIVFLVIS